MRRINLLSLENEFSDTPSETILTEDGVDITLDNPIISSDVIQSDDLVEVTSAYTNIENLNDVIDEAENATVDLVEYQRILGKDEVSDTAIDAIAVAVESIRSAVGFDITKVSLESHTTRKMSLENTIIDTLKRLWESILKSLKKALEWATEFLSKVFDKNAQLEKRLEKLKTKFKSYKQSQLNTSEAVVELKFISSGSNNFSQQAKDLIHAISEFSDYKNTGERFISTLLSAPNKERPKPVDIFGFRLSVDVEDNDNALNDYTVVKYDIEKVKAKNVTEKIPVADLNITTINTCIDGLIGALKKFNKEFEDNNSVIKEIKAQLQSAENNLKKLNEMSDGSKPLGAASIEEKEKASAVVARSKLHFYTKFLPKLSREVYGLALSLTIALETIERKTPLIHKYELN